MSTTVKGRKSSKSNADPAKNRHWFIQWFIWLVKYGFLAVTFPIWGPFMLFKKGIRSILIENYWSFVRGTVYRDKDGNVYKIRFVHYSDLIHLHPMIWIPPIFAVVATAFAGATPALVFATGMLFLFLMITVKFNFPVEKLWKPAVVLIVGLPLIDLGLWWLTKQGHVLALSWFGTEGWVANLLGTEAKGRELLWLFQKWFDAHGLSATPGTFVFCAEVFFLFLVGTILEAILWNRVEMDERDMVEYRILKGENRSPHYMRNVRRVIKDLFELFPFGAAELQFTETTADGRRRKRRYKNVMGLGFGWWLGKAFHELVNKTSKSERDAEQARQQEQDNDEAAIGARPEDAEADHDGDGDNAADSDGFGDDDAHHDHGDDDDHDASDDVGDFADEDDDL